MELARSLLGIAVFVAISWGISTSRKDVSIRTLLGAIGLQVVLAVIMLRTPIGKLLFDGVNALLFTLFNAVGEAASMPFGSELVNQAPFVFKVLPTLVVMSAIMSLLYHWGVMQRVVYFFGVLFRRILGSSGAESVATASNIFIGMAEALVVVRPYLPKMTRSELMLVMTAGMATVAGGQLAAYVGMLQGQFPSIAGHLVTASILSAPAAIMFAKVMVPETEVPETRAGVELERVSPYRSGLHAFAEGTREAIPLAFTILFVLIAFLTMIYFGNAIWGGACNALGSWGVNTESFDTIQELLGYLFLPIAWLTGVSNADLLPAAMLLGEKTMFNEFVAYGHMGEILNGIPTVPGGEPHQFTAHTEVVLAYALCGFANFGSIGILIGGLSVLAEKRTAEVARLGLRAMVAASFACFTTGIIAALVS